MKQAIVSGEFREDLYYRLNVFPLTLPPLRERVDDIPLLAHHFTRQYGAKMGKQIEQIPPGVMSVLQAYPWPGNIRELENIIERAVILTSGSRLELDQSLIASPSAQVTTQGGSTLQEVERAHISQVLEDTAWRIEGRHGAAVRLGLKPSTLRSRMQKLGLTKPPHI